jgi:hypothetical protein
MKTMLKLYPSWARLAEAFARDAERAAAAGHTVNHALQRITGAGLTVFYKKEGAQLAGLKFDRVIVDDMDSPPKNIGLRRLL